MQKYFAYGSNLDFCHFRNRCSSATFFDKAVLEGYKLTFPQYDPEWKGGVAGIIPSRNDRVEGVVYEISDRDLENLDKHEEVTRGDYKRQFVIVKNSLNRFINAWTYSPQGTGEAFYKPPETYKDLIINGAVSHGLSQDYVDYLRRF